MGPFIVLASTAPQHLPPRHPRGVAHLSRVASSASRPVRFAGMPARPSCDRCGWRARARSAGAAEVEVALRPALRIARQAVGRRVGAAQLPLDNLTNCVETVTSFDWANRHSLPRPGPQTAAPAAAPPPSIPPAGLRQPRWCGGGCSNGDPTRASVVRPCPRGAAHSRTWWPTPGRRRRRAAFDVRRPSR